MADGKRPGCTCKWVDALGGKLVRCKHHLALYKHEKAAKQAAERVFNAEMASFGAK